MPLGACRARPQVNLAVSVSAVAQVAARCRPPQGAGRPGRPRGSGQRRTSAGVTVYRVSVIKTLCSRFKTVKIACLRLGDKFFRATWLPTLWNL